MAGGKYPTGHSKYGGCAGEDALKELHKMKVMLQHTRSVKVVFLKSALLLKVQLHVFCEELKNLWARSRQNWNSISSSSPTADHLSALCGSQQTAQQVGGKQESFILPLENLVSSQLCVYFVMMSECRLSILGHEQSLILNTPLVHLNILL